MTRRYRKYFLFAVLAAAVLAAGVFAGRLAGGSREEDNTLMIAGGDDIAGLIFRELAEESSGWLSDGTLAYRNLGDCCGSNAQFTLSTGEVDIAILCPDAIRELLETGDYVVWGTVTYDENVLVTKPDHPDPIRVIGYMNQRGEQRSLLEQLYGESVKLESMFPSGLAYALETDVVDAVVLDALGAMKIGYPVTVLSSGRPTSVMAVKSSLADDPRVAELAGQYRSYIDSLKEDAAVGELLCSYLETDKQEEVVKRWKRMKVQFGSLERETD